MRDSNWSLLALAWRRQRFVTAFVRRDAMRRVCTLLKAATTASDADGVAATAAETALWPRPDISRRLSRAVRSRRPSRKDGWRARTVAGLGRVQGCSVRRARQSSGASSPHFVRAAACAQTLHPYLHLPSQDCVCVCAASGAGAGKVMLHTAALSMTLRPTVYHKP